MTNPIATAIRGLGLIALYLVVSIGPLAFMFFGSPPAHRPFPVELSAALGFVGLSLMSLQFVLVGKFQSVGAPFGIDMLVRFHKQVSFVALAFILAHPILLFVQSATQYLPLLLLGSAPWRARFGVAAIAVLVVLIALSVWRRWLRMSYEAWQLSHGLLAIGVVALALAHIDGVGYYTQGLVRQVLFDVLSVATIGLLVWTRLLRPLARETRRWRVRGVRREAPETVTLQLQPAGHRGFSFIPGQFAWLSRFPVALTSHPFSFSSPSEGSAHGQLSITVKALGRSSHAIASLRRGKVVYLDGPHGGFSIDLHEGPGYVFIAAGVGITPVFSMLGTMCVREDPRPVTLLYANRDWDSIIFREQLDELSLYMPSLTLVHVLQEPPEGWTGEVGRVRPKLVLRHLPRTRPERFQYFVCGPERMMDSVEQTLTSVGVPADHIHSERFGI
ncbi:MAG TPA: ferric reductase-like transmembrane domain-containing protein [Candidatus Binatia bacterium]|nr:ferric reductase-like transmembrane domain-containing protein [Candidatus Binatia bacterium]